MRRRILPFFLISMLLLLAGCQGSSEPRSGDSETARAGAGTTSSDPDKPMSWGPTPAELAKAQELVADWSPAELAGQVIVGR